MYRDRKMGIAGYGKKNVHKFCVIISQRGGIKIQYITLSLLNYSIRLVEQRG